MATSGSKSVKVTDWDTLKFSWSQKSQSVANNTTTISWKLELISGSDGRIESGTTKTWTVVVNGTKYTGKVSIAIGNNTTRTLASGETTIAHNSDGSKTFSYSFAQVFEITFSGSWIGEVSGSGSGIIGFLLFLLALGHFAQLVIALSLSRAGLGEEVILINKAGSLTCIDAEGVITGISQSLHNSGAYLSAVIPFVYIHDELAGVRSHPSGTAILGNEHARHVALAVGADSPYSLLASGRINE
jgi:hypothetical protein